MNTPARIQSGARSDSHRHYRAELREHVEGIERVQAYILDTVADLDAERFYTAPETKGMLRDAAMGLGAIKRTLDAALRELPTP